MEVFAHIYVYKEDYNLKYSFKTYIFTIGRNKAIDYVRKQSRVVLTPFDKDYEFIKEEESLEDKVIKDEEKAHLFRVMKESK